MNTKSMFGKPSYSGGEAMFNFAINLYLLNTYRRLGKLPSSKINGICNTLNIGDFHVSKGLRSTS